LPAVAATFLLVGLAGCSFMRPPVAPGAQACVGVPQEVCQEVIQGRINNRAPVKLSGYQVVCKSATCTVDSGQVEVDLRWEDGQTETFSYTWN
jgi:hypothetical protein